MADARGYRFSSDQGATEKEIGGDHIRSAYFQPGLA